MSIPPAGPADDHPVRGEQDRVQALVDARHGQRIAQLLERQPVWARDFTDLSYEWRRLFSELFGTFLLVLVAAGAGVVQDASGAQIGRLAEVTAPALTVLAVILFIGGGVGFPPEPGRVHRVRIAAGLRLAAGTGLCGRAAGRSGARGRAAAGDVRRRRPPRATLPGPGFSNAQAFTLELVLTLGLVLHVLGTASTAQNIGTLSAIGVSAYIAVAGLWSSPVSGASMNPVRSLAPALLTGDLHRVWIHPRSAC